MTASTGARLLSTEQAALLPILRRTPAEAFDRPTVCTGWTVRDVLAHCGCALTRAAEGRMHAFTPELNEIDVQPADISASMAGTMLTAGDLDQADRMLQLLVDGLLVHDRS